jgi:hypothetical protein
MSKNTYTVTIICAIVSIIGGLYYTSSHVSHDPVKLATTHTGLITDIASPFGSGGSSSGIVFDTTPTQPTWETSSGKEVFFNTNWIGRVVTIQGKSAHYQFGSGNPLEFDKSREEIIQINKDCNLAQSTEESMLCNARLGQGESLSNIYLPDGTEGLSYASRMTPEIEYLVYSFLSNPIIRQSSEKCSEFFWKDGNEGAPFYNNETMHEDMGEVMPENWWKPYRIDINQLIVINPNTGRKELNIDPIWTLRTQIMAPPVTRDTPGHYTNIKLTNCLSKNNILTPLQTHVDRHYRELIWLWREYKVEV